MQGFFYSSTGFFVCWTVTGIFFFLTCCCRALFEFILCVLHRCHERHHIMAGEGYNETFIVRSREQVCLVCVGRASEIFILCRINMMRRCSIDKMHGMGWLRCVGSIKL